MIKERNDYEMEYDDERDVDYFNLFSDENLIIEITDKKTETIKPPKNKTSKKTIDECAQNYLNNPNDQTFAELWKRSYWGLREHAHKLGVPSNFDIDDIIINTFEIILKKNYQFDATRGKFSTWMYNICTNECFAYWNRKKRDNCVDIDISSGYQGNRIMASQIDDYDYSDKFEVKSPIDMKLLQKDDIKQAFLDASISEIKNFKDERIRDCMLERINFYKKDDDSKPLTLEQIAQKYDYPITSVKNWVNKGKIQLRDAMLKRHKDLFEMWQEVLD